MTGDFRIFESMLWEPGGGYFLLDLHLQRLARSAGHFGFLLDADDARLRLLHYAEGLGVGPRKVRLLLARGGNITLEDVAVKPSTPVRVALADEPVDSADEFLRHKTTRREVYDRALASHPEAQDVVLWNERGELTETCTGNVVVELDGRRLTPPLASGLLPGVFRAYLLERGEIEEAVLPVKAIEQAERVFLINSVRKWCEMLVLPRDEKTPGAQPCAPTESP